MLKAFSATNMRDLEEKIYNHARENYLKVDCFSVVYNGCYEALVKFTVRL